VREQRQQALKFSLLQRADLWREGLARARRFARGTTEDAADAARMADDYRLLAHDLARARRLLPDTRTREYLEAAYARAHTTLHHGAWRLGATLLTLFRDEIPAVVRWLRPYILWSAIIFALALVAGYALVHTYPDLIALFASPDVIAGVERGKLWTDGMLNIVPPAVVSVQIFANNIVVSLTAWCTGFLFGLGTLYALGLNGLLLGAALAFVSQHGLRDQLLTFIVAHGCVELSVICLSGAAGAAVGEALARPGEAGRMESFRVAVLRSGKLLIACVVLLIGAGLIEGYVSPNPRVPLSARVVIGVGYWLFMVLMLSGWLFGRPRTATP
jgi:uncharacterized membrane protein SpoIIM required for sporulation